MAASFIDSNVLLCLASSDLAKATQAEALLAGDCVVSVQVLNEIANVARRKMAMSWSETASFVSDIRALVSVVPLTEATHDLGLRLAERHVLSVWDSMFVAAATEAGCETLWSEDMHHGLVTDNGPRIANPFLAP